MATSWTHAMRTRTSRDTPRATTLIAAMLLVGCDPGIRGEGSEREGAGGGGSTTATSPASGGTTSASTGGDGDHPLCVDPDPAVQLAVGVTLSHWSADRPGDAPNIDLRARCEVRSAARGGAVVDVSLACVDEAGGAFDADLRLEVPSDVAIDVASGETVQLDLAAHGVQGEIGPGTRFAIDDAAGDLVFAAYDDETDGYVADSWSRMIDPLEPTVDHGICPSWTCPTEASPECPDGGIFQRHGLIVGAGQHGVRLVDGRRDVLAIEDGSYDVLVGSAAGYFKISSRFGYRFLVARRR